MACYSLPMIQSEVGQRLRAIRDDRGWTQDAVAADMTTRLAELTDVGEEAPSIGGAAISAVEKGKAGMALNRLELLAKCLRARVRVFVLKEEDHTEPVVMAEGDAAVLSSLHEASETDRDLLVRLVDAADQLTDDDREYLMSLVRVLERRHARPTG